VRVTAVPDAYVPPLGDRATVPPPGGEAATVSVYCAVPVKFAVTLLFAFIVTVAGLVAPLASPDHEPNEKPDAAIAVRVATHPDGIELLLGDWATVPPPEGETATVSVYSGGGGGGVTGDLHEATAKQTMRNIASLSFIIASLAQMTDSLCQSKSHLTNFCAP
jgi:hypothetical protein